MSFSGDIQVAALDGISAHDLAKYLSLPRVELFPSVGSTLDVAHKLAAEGAPSGTLIVADEQTAGRGRLGRRWSSAPGAGLWVTLIERPLDSRALDVLALRVGLYTAEALDHLAHGIVNVKWPNDLYLRTKKLGGILIETRWRGTKPEWVAIGVGLNILNPTLATATGLNGGTTRRSALEVIVPAIRRAAAASGHLSIGEVQRWSARDFCLGKEVIEPEAGVVSGISTTGEILISANGNSTSHRSGSVTFAPLAACS